MMDEILAMESGLNTEILEQYDEDMYNDLCERADFYGMDSLTEDEQYVVDNFKAYMLQG